MIWGESDFSSKVQKKFYEEARCYRIHQGISYPVHGANGEFGMISFVLDEFSDRSFRYHLMQQMPDLALIRDFAYQSSLRFTRFPEQPQIVPVLTGRELECLNWATAAKSSWEISRILGCSEATVNFHFFQSQAQVQRDDTAAGHRQGNPSRVDYTMIRHAAFPGYSIKIGARREFDSRELQAIYQFRASDFRERLDWNVDWLGDPS